MSAKYSATRCNLVFGQDLEQKAFDRKADAVKWAKKCAFGRVRLQTGNRPIVFDKSDFFIPSFS